MSCKQTYIKNLTHTEKRVLLTLLRYWRFSGGGNSWKSFEKLSKFINRPLSETRKAVHSLKEKGVLKYSVAVTSEGVPHGSGYFLTAEWSY